MNNQSTNDEENDKQQTTSNRRPFRSEFLTKIYYPDTLYPDSYKFFADRRSPQQRSQSMDTNNQNPTTDANETSTIPAPVSTQLKNEIELIERQNKTSVSIDCIRKRK